MILNSTQAVGLGAIAVLLCEFVSSGNALLKNLQNPSLVETQIGFKFRATKMPDEFTCLFVTVDCSSFINSKIYNSTVYFEGLD